MPKPAPKLKKAKRPEGAVEATINVRMNSDGADVIFECGNADCQAQLGDPEDHKFTDGKFIIEPTLAGEEVECEECETVNYNDSFTVQKV